MIPQTLSHFLNKQTLVLGLFFLFLGPSIAKAGPIDDCGFLFESADGCLLFRADFHAGSYHLAYYGSFVAGNRVHVSGDHDSSCFGPCASSCIRSNSISEGCSQLCSGIPNDANNDGRMNIGDILLVLQYIFLDFQNFACVEQADCNLNGRIEIADITCMLDILF